MTREYIMRFQVDEDDHEYDMTRMQELVRCVDCKNGCVEKDRESDEVYCSEHDFYKWDDFFCGSGERKK